jgi:hypothetical protein
MINSNLFYNSGVGDLVFIQSASGIQFNKNTFTNDNTGIFTLIDGTGGNKIIFDSNVFQCTSINTTGRSFNLSSNIGSGWMVRNNVEQNIGNGSIFNAVQKIYSIGNHWNVGQVGTGVFIQNYLNTTGAM